MKISATISYPSATPEQTFALAVDPAFREAVCEATRALRYDVSVATDGDTASVTVSRTMPAEVPDIVRSFIGETVDVVQSERWGPPDADGERRADLVVQVKGQPATMQGTATIRRAGGGSVVAIEGDLDVAVPFFGKKVEPEIAKGIYAAIEKEQQTGRDWLS